MWTGRRKSRGFTPWGKRPAPGLHGANRLASNSLLEALVCAHRAARAGRAKPATRQRTRSIPALAIRQRRTTSDELVVVSHNWDEIRRLMWDYVGIVRTNKRLQRARSRIANLQEEIQEYYWDFMVNSDLLELRNIATVAELIITSALQRPGKPRPALQPGLSRPPTPPGRNATPSCARPAYRSGPKKFWNRLPAVLF